MDCEMDIKSINFREIQFDVNFGSSIAAVTNGARPTTVCCAMYEFV